jgi:hypothetical protein
MEVETRQRPPNTQNRCREGNNLICFVKIKRMEVENKAKASKHAKPPAGKGII